MISVDGVDFLIREPWPFVAAISNIWYSHKYIKPALRYEIGLCIRTGHIVWVHGPFPAGKHNDETIFSMELAKMLDENERVEADKGYRSLVSKAKTPGYYSDMYPEKTNLQNAVRGRHESVNRRFKIWGILGGTYRHPLSKFSTVMDAIIFLTQLSIEDGEPLFHVDYDDNDFVME